MKTVSIGIRAVCLCLLVALVGCNRADPRVFNETIVSGNKKLNASGKAMGEALVGVMQDQSGSVDKLKTAFANVKKTITEVKAELAAVKVPDDPSSKALASMYQQFLQGQESMASNEFDQIVKYAEDQSLSTSVKANKILPLLKTAEEKEKNDLSELQAAQRTFASEHHILLRTDQ